MLCRLPSSRARLRLRLSPVDVALAAASPLVALYLRNGALPSNSDWISAGSYSLVSLACSITAFQILGISGIITRYLSVKDLVDVAKAVLTSELMTATALFTVSRLDGIPRSVPAIHALTLAAGLIAYRKIANFTDTRRSHSDRCTTSENVILIGLSDWSVLFMRYLQIQAPQRRRVIALLDEDPRWIGRSVNGVQILGPPAYLPAAIEEFATHGLRTDRVILGGKPSELSAEALAAVRDTCAQRNLDLVFVPCLSVPNFAELNCSAVHKDRDRQSSSDLLPRIRMSGYFRIKRLTDVIIALLLIITVLPLLAVTTLMVLLDVGWPVWFWQQRTGQGGHELQLYKLRTLRSPFDRRGRRIPEERRLSCIGRVLRRTRFDELPQLLNVFVGDMSLIGPRPLLPRDQPPNSALRLTVRPGITGWAQVNGGTLLSSTEKDALDVWYILNASLWLDLRIICMTFCNLAKGDQRREEVLARAGHSCGPDRGSEPGTTVQFATGDAGRPDNARPRPAAEADGATAALLVGSQAR